MSIPAMSALGQWRLRRSKPHDGVCPLCPRKRTSTARQACPLSAKADIRIAAAFAIRCGLKADVSEVRDVARPDKLETLMVSRVVSRDLPRQAMLALAPLKYER